MVKAKKTNSNTVSYFNLKSSKKIHKSPTRSPTREKTTKRSRSDESKGKNILKINNNSKSSIAKRSKSVDVPKTNRQEKLNNVNQTKSTNQIKKPLRTGNIPLQEAKKKTNEKQLLPKDLFEARFRGKKILVFKNSNDGHLIEEPLPMAVSEHSYPTFDSLLNYLNEKLTMRTGRINKLYKIQGGEISEIKQLRDKGWYVASTGPYIPEGAIEKVNKKYSKDDFDTIFDKNEEIENEIKEEEAKKSSKKPPVPKFNTVKKLSTLNTEKTKSTKKMVPLDPLASWEREKLEENFGRKGTLRHHIRVHSASSPTFGKSKKNNNVKSEFDGENGAEEIETNVFASRPLSRSQSQKSFPRSRFQFDDEDFVETSKPRSNIFDEEEQEQVDFGRRQSEGLGYLRQTSAKRSEPYFSQSKRQSLKEENYNDELVYEPSEIEPMNKIMYPTGHRPPSRKDAANSPRARDAALSAKGYATRPSSQLRRGVYNQNGEFENGQYENEEYYDEENFEEPERNNRNGGGGRRRNSIGVEADERRMSRNNRPSSYDNERTGGRTVSKNSTKNKKASGNGLDKYDFSITVNHSRR